MNVTKLRADTPGCANRVHLNNAGASLMPAPIVDAITTHLDLEASIGGYEAELEAAAEIGAAYENVAGLLGTSGSNIAFSEHATASFVAALSAVRFSAGDVVLTTRNDYVSNQIQYLALADRFGVEVLRAPDAPEGGVDLAAIEGLIHRRRPRLVAVTHIPTNSGLVQDVTAIGAMCRARDILYLVDGCQSVGQMPVDVEAIGCDFFSATARKYLRGPRGLPLRVRPRARCGPRTPFSRHARRGLGRARPLPARARREAVRDMGVLLGARTRDRCCGEIRDRPGP